MPGSRGEEVPFESRRGLLELENQKLPKVQQRGKL